MAMRTAAAALSMLLLLGACSGEADHRVLFVGNSYTHSNDMPDMVATITDAHGTSIKWTMIAPGGAFLDQHATDPAVVAALQSGDHDIVVFQEQSVITSVPDMAASRTIPAARTLDALADAAGVRVLWFQTWGHLDGFPDVDHTSYTTMQDQVSATYDRIGDATDAPVVRVGDTWRQVQARGTGIGLYAPDGSHPSPAGSYVAALRIAEAILGQTPSEAPDVAGVSDEQATTLLAALG